MNTLVRFLPCWFSVALAHAAAQPNILFLAVDDLRPELACYGKDYIQSPNIDRIAKAGMVFDRAYCQQAVCSPSRSSLMTGTRPDTTKVWDLVTHFRAALPHVATLGQHFKNHGYFVQGMGKIYHGGYDDPQTWSVPWQTPRAVKYALPENRELDQRQHEGEPDGGGKRDTRKNIRGPAFESAEVPDDTFQDGKVAELAIQTLRDLRSNSRPTSSAPRARRTTPSCPAASCATITGYRLIRSPTTWPASSSTATMPPSVTWMRRWARCWMSWTG